MLDPATREYWIIDWLKRHGPAEWHGYVERHHWDGENTAPLEWIVSQPDCDAATALTIFWMAEPDYYLDGEHDHDPVAQLLLAIAARWQGEGFPRQRFAFDDGFPEILERINAGPHKLPASSAEPIDGEENFTWFNALPAEIDIAWHRANGRAPPAHLLATQAAPRSVAERPGRIGREDAARVWAALGPSSAFRPVGTPSPAAPSGVFGRLRRWLDPNA